MIDFNNLKPSSQLSRSAIFPLRLKPFAPLLLLCAGLALTLLTACGGSDDPEPTPEPVVEAPRVVSITPEDGTRDIEAGQIDITVVFDQNIVFRPTDYSKILATSGSVTAAKAGKKELYITFVCGPGATATLTIPSGVVTNTRNMPAAEVTFTYTTKANATPDPGYDDGHEQAADAVKNMGPGWNLGNTLDSYGAWIGDHQPSSKYETAWGQPLADAHLMRALKEKGFGAIRVPVTWYQHIQADGTVDADWMDRVQQVVDYVLDAGMYCVLNVHHDTGAHDDAWVVADLDVYNGSDGAMRTRFESLWTQIATRFRNYSDKLIFEGYNEMLDKGFHWSQPTSSQSYAAVTGWAESFVKAVRATGGNNQYRNLVVTTYSAAHGDQVLSNFKMPENGGGQNHLIAEVHSYDPYDWVHTYNFKWTDACHNELLGMFQRLQKYIFSQGYPVIIGEYGSNGAGEATINKSSTAAQKAEAGRQAADMSRLCRQYGAACFYWMGIIEGADRAEATFQWSMEQVADSIIKVYQ